MVILDIIVFSWGYWLFSNFEWVQWKFSLEDNKSPPFPLPLDWFSAAPTRALSASMLVRLSISLLFSSILLLRCVFLSSSSGSLKRLKALEDSLDGFYLAQADLLLCGPGDQLRKKQSGHLPEFPIARLKIDGDSPTSTPCCFGVRDGEGTMLLDGFI